MSDATPLGLIAGGGAMPLRIADAVSKTGRQLRILVIEGQGNPADYRAFPDVHKLPLGQVGRGVALLRAARVRDLAMAGRVQRPSLMSLRFDAEGARLMAKLGRAAVFGGDDALLKGVVKLMRDLGFNPVGAPELLQSLLVESGLLGRQAPDALAEADIRRGLQVTAALGRADAGQGCVVQQGLVLAMEGIEGTDAMIARAGTLRREGPGGVLVKLVKPKQDQRADLPVIGPDTVAAARDAGLRGLAIEGRAGHAGTIVLDRAETIAAADAAGMFILALRPAAYLQQEKTP
jgi:hypothetical protein